MLSPEIIADAANIGKYIAQKSHLRFMHDTWRGSDEFKVGIHTEGISNEIDLAFENYRNGLSTYLMVECCFRQGKSDCVSRYLPPHFLGEFPDGEVIVAAHTSSLAVEFSRDARNIMRSDSYRAIYPDVVLSDESSAVDSWRLRDSNGKTLWTGILGGSVGHGCGLLVVDDFFKLREEAESVIIRDKTWYEFTNSLMSRRAPVCIVIIAATSWHIDDLFGRIRKQMQEDPAFPQFKEIKWPAYSDKYPTGVLFPERYDRGWYDSNRATLGNYSFSALMQCVPIPRGGNMLRTDKIQWLDAMPDGLRWARGWDLASSKKELTKSDPDYTVGAKVAVKFIPSAIPGVRIPLIFIGDIIRGRWEAGQRNEIIRDTAIAEPGCRVGCESFGAYKDAFTLVRDSLNGIRHVEGLQLPGDKRSKAEILVPALEAGNFFCLNGQWKDEFLAELNSFPDGTHDDICDALVTGFHTAVSGDTLLVQWRIDLVDKGEFKLDDDIGWEQYHGLYMQPDSTLVITALWNSHTHVLYVVRQKEFRAIDEIVKYCHNGSHTKTVVNEDILSNDFHSLYRILIQEKLVTKPMANYDALASVYRLNTLIQEGCFRVNQGCTDLIIAMQNDSDIKHLSPPLQALLFIVSDNMEKFRPAPPPPYKPFDRQRFEANEALKYGGKPVPVRASDWIN